MDVWYDGSHAISFYRYGTSSDPVGDLVGHTWKNWGLVPTSRPFVAPPEQKTSTIEIQGADGVIDTSESLTKWPIYNNRTGSWTFYVTDYNNHDNFVLDSNEEKVLDNGSDPIRTSIVNNWAGMYTRLLNTLHGKMMVIILDDDPDYFYKGRFKISQWVSSNDGSLSGLTIDYDLFPYKLNKTNTGILISEANPTVELIGGRQPVIPYIYTKQKNSNATGKIKLEFTNPELGVHHSNIEYSNCLPYYTLMEDLGTKGEFADFIVTNLSGNNVCTLSITNMSLCEYVYLKFREGEL